MASRASVFTTFTPIIAHITKISDVQSGVLFAVTNFLVVKMWVVVFIGLFTIFISKINLFSVHK